MKNKIVYRKLGEFVKLKQGLAINAQSAHLVSETKQGKFLLPLLRIADMMDGTYKKYISIDVNKSVIANKDDIIYTRTGQIGLVFTGYNGVVHNNSFIVELNSSELNKEYLLTILSTDYVRNQALNFAKNSVQPDLTHDMFKEIIIPVFRKDVQKAITRVYSQINNKINLNNKINDNLSNYDMVA